jgi:hypothetical protein
MATLTSKERKNIKAQLDAVQKKINDIKAARATPIPSAPSGQVMGATDSLPTGLNPAQMGGASGVGLEDEETQNIISTQTDNTIKSGGSKSQAGDRVSSSQAGSLLKSSGLDGLFDSKSLVGKSFGEAAQIVQEEKAKRTGQISANTSFAFNPEVLKRTQRAIDKFGFALNDVTNDPFEPKEFKDEEAKNTIEVTSRELGSLFETPEQLYQAYNSNQQFRESLDKFIKKGGTLEGVSKNITAPVAGTPLQQAQSELGGPNIQTPDQYLSDLRNPQANQEAEKIALEELAPESAVAQAEISRVAGIPKELQTLYFGDEKTMGVLQMKQEQSIERIKLIEEQERDAKRTARNKAELQVERNRAEVERSKSQIEENRLAAKNYMTAQLAKLGALNTTGTAPLALQTLETKYQGQVNQLDSNFKLAEREIEIGLEESIDSIENQANDFVLKIEEDITIDREKSIKEILKARQDADKEVYRITEQYSRRLRERTTKYTEDLKKEAEKYAKEFAKNASNGLDGGPLGIQEGQYVEGKGILLPNGKYAKLDLTPTQATQVESANLSGADTIRYFVSIPEKFRGMIIQEAQGNGTKFSTIGALKSRYEQLKAEDEAEDEPEYKPL